MKKHIFWELFEIINNVLLFLMKLFNYILKFQLSLKKGFIFLKCKLCRMKIMPNNF